MDRKSFESGDGRERPDRACIRPILAAGFIEKGEDFLAMGKPTYRVADPMVRSHDLISRCNEDRCEE
jgi:hypothetical protein